MYIRVYQSVVLIAYWWSQFINKYKMWMCEKMDTQLFIFWTYLTFAYQSCPCLWYEILLLGRSCFYKEFQLQSKLLGPTGTKIVRLFMVYHSIPNLTFNLSLFISKVVWYFTLFVSGSIVTSLSFNIRQGICSPVAFSSARHHSVIVIKPRKK